MTISQVASNASLRTSRLKGRESNNTKGTAKWNMARMRPMDPHPPFRRRTYHVISSGKFPAHMMSHWENSKYAHTMMKASISFPRSCRVSALATALSGGSIPIREITTMQRASADRAWPIMNSMP